MEDLYHKLLPCPFCADYAFFVTYEPKEEAKVQCSYCGASTKIWENAKRAFNAWNTRRTEKQHKVEVSEENRKPLTERFWSGK